MSHTHSASARYTKFLLLLTLLAGQTRAAETSQTPTQGAPCLPADPEIFIPPHLNFEKRSPEQLLFLSATPAMVAFAKTRGSSLLNVLKTSEFGNTPLHMAIANHRYIAAEAMLDTFSNEKERALEMKDKNDRTPLHLGAMIAAPGSMLTKLMTPKNVVFKDKQGTTMLMLAAAGLMEKDTLNTLLHHIGPNRIRKFLKLKDSQGRGVAEYATMKKEDIEQILRSAGVNPHKAANACSDALFSMEGYQISPLTEQTLTLLKDLGFQLSKSTIFGGAEHTVDTTAENARKIIRMATEQKKSDPHYQAREAINHEWKEAFGRSDDECTKIWKNYNKWAGRLLRDGTHRDVDTETLSDTSLIDAALARQQENLEQMQSFYRREGRTQSARASNNEREL